MGCSAGRLAGGGAIDGFTPEAADNPASGGGPVESAPGLVILQPKPGKSFSQGELIEIAAAGNNLPAASVTGRALGNGAEICAMGAGALSCSWNASVTGTVEIVVEALDAEGNRLVSPPVKISVFPPERSVTIYSAAAAGTLRLASDGSLQALPGEPVLPDDLFDLVPNADGTVSLKARKNGKYLTAVDASTPVRAEAVDVGPAQKFEMTPQGADTVVLRSVQTGKHMEVNGDRGWGVYTSWNDPDGLWQKLALRSPMLTVDVDAVQRDLRTLPLGINFNYLRDDNANRPFAPTLQSALRQNRPGWIRYPGGEKSDWHLWSKPPWDSPQPTAIGWYQTALEGKDPLDFDEYIAYVREIGAAPFVVVGYDSFARTGKTKEEYLVNAVEWVRYANIKKGYGVRYWEIGNENWHNSTGTPEALAAVVSEFSRAMKAVDPTIQIGASGNSTGWWSGFLPIAAKDIDFLTVSQYSCWQWGSYEYFVTHEGVNLLETAADAAAAIRASAPSEADRLKVVITEFNSKDYAEGGWPDGNDLGHALVNFELAGQILANRDILFGMQWNTRWVDDDQANSLWYALGPMNETKAVGWPLRLWGRFAKDFLVEASALDKLRAYATHSAQGDRLALFLLNKTHVRRQVTVRVRNTLLEGEVKRFAFLGQSPEDTDPVLREDSPVTFTDNELTLELDPLSITILEK